MRMIKNVFFSSLFFPLFEDYHVHMHYISKFNYDDSAAENVKSWLA